MLFWGVRLMMNNIDKYRKIRKERLDRNHYTISLFNEGVRTGLIDQATQDNFLTQIMILLAELMHKYTYGESSSLKVETTQRFLLSILYAVDSLIISIPDPGDALELLASTDLKEIYKKGLEQLEDRVEDSQQLYMDIRKNKLPIKNEAYHDTIDEALSEFFRSYDVLFGAQETMCSIDYPLLFDDMNIQGIDYIKQYLERLQLENQFCRLFAQEDIDQLLSDYGRVYRINYSEALINIFEVILNNAIFSVLSGNVSSQLKISSTQLGFLRQFADLDGQLCSSLISAAIEKLILDLQIYDPLAKEYIRDYHSVFATRFSNALENNCLENVVIIEQTAIQEADMAFFEGKRLGNEEFLLLVDQILACSQTEEKTAMVLSGIHSLGDFIDIMEADCFYGEEYHDLFNSLGEAELSILTGIVFMEEIRSNPQEFALAKPVKEMDLQIEWQIEFARFVSERQFEPIFKK